MTTTRRTIGFARVIPVGAANSHGFSWEWRAADGTSVSERTFGYFYDCVVDARRHGYDVEIGPLPAGLQTPGASRKDN